MNRLQFALLKEGDTIRGPDNFGTVTVTSVQKALIVNERNQPQRDENGYTMWGTWAIETDPYQYVKVQDRYLGMPLIEFLELV